jgi:hypothetical protein
MHTIPIKRITLSLLAIILIGAAVVGMSKGLFQDEEVAGSSISLGTLNLKIGEDDPSSIALDFTGMEPGEERVYSFNLRNTGQVQGNFWFEGEVLTSLEGINSESEADIEEPGDLAACAKMNIEVDDLHGNTPQLVTDTYLSAMGNSFETESGTYVDEGVNHGPIEMRVKVDTYDCGPEAMGDIVDMNLNFYLEQEV